MLEGERDQREKEGMQAGRIKWGEAEESENHATEIMYPQAAF